MAKTILKQSRWELLGELLAGLANTLVRFAILLAGWFALAWIASQGALWAILVGAVVIAAIVIHAIDYNARHRR